MIESALGLDRSGLKAAKAGYDASCKRLLSDKTLLAWILSSCVEEFRSCSPAEIAEKYIIGTPKVAKVAVHADEMADDVLSERMMGMQNEDTSDIEGTVTYDIRFSAEVPSSGESVHLILNLEAQRDFHPGYPLVKRGIYYCSRLISSQRGIVFHKSGYDKIQKVYSIWICLKTPKYGKNAITHYRMTENCIEGAFLSKPQYYDLLSLVMIGLGDYRKTDNSLLKILDVIFSEELTVNEKILILETECDFPVAKEMKREVDTMCNFSDAIEERGILKGLQQGIEQGIQQGIQQGIEQGIQQGRMETAMQMLHHLAEKMQISHEEAARLLGIPEKEVHSYLAGMIS